MIQITPQMKIFVATEPADFRKGIDGLAQLVRERLQGDPFDGSAFVFRNRKRTAIKVLVYDGQGYWLCYKRLSKGRFEHWPQRSDDAKARSLLAHELTVLLSGGNFERVEASPLWRDVRPASAS